MVIALWSFFPVTGGLRHDPQDAQEPQRAAAGTMRPDRMHGGDLGSLGGERDLASARRPAAVQRASRRYPARIRQGAVPAPARVADAGRSGSTGRADLAAFGRIRPDGAGRRTDPGADGHRRGRPSPEGGGEGCTERRRLKRGRAEAASLSTCLSEGDERTARLAGRRRDAGGARGAAGRAGRPVGAPGDDRSGRVLGSTIGYDPRLHSPDALATLRAAVEKAGATLKAVEANPIDLAWGDARPAQPQAPVVPHEDRYTGEDAASKRVRIGKAIADAGAEAAPAAGRRRRSVSGRDHGRDPHHGHRRGHRRSAPDVHPSPEGPHRHGRDPLPGRDQRAPAGRHCAPAAVERGLRLRPRHGPRFGGRGHPPADGPAPAGVGDRHGAAAGVAGPCSEGAADADAGDGLADGASVDHVRARRRRGDGGGGDPVAPWSRHYRGGGGLDPADAGDDGAGIARRRRERPDRDAFAVAGGDAGGVRGGGRAVSAQRAPSAVPSGAAGDAGADRGAAGDEDALRHIRRGDAGAGLPAGTGGGGAGRADLGAAGDDPAAGETSGLRPAGGSRNGHRQRRGHRLAVRGAGRDHGFHRAARHDDAGGHGGGLSAGRHTGAGGGDRADVGGVRSDDGDAAAEPAEDQGLAGAGLCGRGVRARLRRGAGVSGGPDGGRLRQSGHGAERRGDGDDPVGCGQFAVIHPLIPAEAGTQQPEPFGRRSHRPLLPAPHRPQYADRGDGRGHGRAGEGGQGPLHRPVRGGARDPAPRPCRASDRGLADRVFAVEPRPGGRTAGRAVAPDAAGRQAAGVGQCAAISGLMHLCRRQGHGGAGEGVFGRVVVTEGDAQFGADVVQLVRGEVRPADLGQFHGAEVVELGIGQAVVVAGVADDADVEGGVVGQHRAAFEARGDGGQDGGEFLGVLDLFGADAVEGDVEAGEAHPRRADVVVLDGFDDPVVDPGQADGAGAGPLLIGGFEVDGDGVHQETSASHSSSVRTATPCFSASFSLDPAPARDLGTEAFGAGLGFVAGEAFQRAGEDDGLARHRAVGHGGGDVLDAFELGQQGVDDLKVVRLVEEVGQGLGGDRADAGDARDLVQHVGGAFIARDGGPAGQVGPAFGDFRQRAAGGCGHAGEGEGDLLIHRRFRPRIVGGRLRLGHQAQDAGRDGVGRGQGLPVIAGEAVRGGHAGVAEGGPAAEGARQDQRGLLADLTHAQTEDQAVEADDAARVDAGDQVADAGLAIAVLGAQQGQLLLVAGQAEDIGGLLDPAARVEGDQLLFAEAFNVEGAPADEMLEAFDDLGVADQAAGAAALDLVPLAHGFGAADGADGGEDVRDGALGTQRIDHADDLGDDVAGALQDDGVADADVLAGDLVLVVQGGVADHDAADGDGMQAGDGGQGAGAADLDVDAFQNGRGLLRRELVGDGPSRASGDEAEALLPVQTVDLVDHAVDVVAEAAAVGLQRLIDADQAVGALDTGRAVVDLKAPGAEGFQRAVLGVGEGGGGLAPGVGEEGQGALGRDLWVFLTQRPGGEVARIGVGALAFGLGRRVESVEGGVGGVDLAPDFDDVGPAGARQRLGDAVQGAQVGGHVLARLAVAARGALDQDALFVAQAGREAVDLGLGDEGDGLVARQLQEARDAGHEVAHLAVVEGVVQRQHGHAVADLCELGRDGGADALGRGDGAGQGREADLQRRGRQRLGRGDHAGAGQAAEGQPARAQRPDRGAGRRGAGPAGRQAFRRGAAGAAARDRDEPELRHDGAGRQRRQAVGDGDVSAPLFPPGAGSGSGAPERRLRLRQGHARGQGRRQLGRGVGPCRLPPRGPAVPVFRGELSHGLSPSERRLREGQSGGVPGLDRTGHRRLPGAGPVAGSVTTVAKRLQR
uniref:Amidase domain-containing protein n=1 Tax=Parastrongyloides trichosuri TaxID=131310 RepID=A0A0N4ZWK6_PARTI